MARERFDFLGWFEGIVVSGEEGIAKPDPAIYQILLDRYGVEAGRPPLFVDDRAENVEAAEALGMRGRRVPLARGPAGRPGRAGAAGARLRRPGPGQPAATSAMRTGWPVSMER